MQKMLFAATFTLASVFAGWATAVAAANKDPLDTRTISTIESRFSKLMELANKHDIKGLHEMFWQSPAALLVAKSAIPSEGNWAGFWGNDAIDKKLHDIAASGPVALTPDSIQTEGRRANPRYRGILCAYGDYRLLCWTGRNSKAVPDDNQLEEDREGLEGRLRNHPTRAADDVGDSGSIGP
jgi:hypothetical protein